MVRDAQMCPVLYDAINHVETCDDYIHVIIDNARDCYYIEILSGNGSTL